jgi:GYF domain 2
VSEIRYYANPQSNAQQGPLELRELKDLLAKLPNARDALVWREDFPEWKKAGDVPVAHRRYRLHLYQRCLRTRGPFGELDGGGSFSCSPEEIGMVTI